MAAVEPIQKAALLLTAAFSFVPGVATAQMPNYEYTAQPNLAQIGITPSLHNSISGAGVAVAILDGFAGAGHVDLKGKTTDIFVYPGTYDLSNWAAVHGTHVAGIAAGNRNGVGMVGVAPGAHVYNMPMFDNGPCSSSVACRWVGYAGAGKGKYNDYAAAALSRIRTLNKQSANIRAVNMSFVTGAAGDNFGDGELNLFSGYRDDFVIVRAAGNTSSVLQAEKYSGTASQTLSHLLLVGSVDPRNKISTFSNTPGAGCIAAATTNCAPAERLANYFVVAPGEDITSACPGCNYAMPGGWTPMWGTSMATPHVTGAVALVAEDGLKRKVSLSPSDIASILKLSATDLGAKGVDPVYGWGLINLRAALSPVGPPTIPTGPTVPVPIPTPPATTPPPTIPIGTTTPPKPTTPPAPAKPTTPPAAPAKPTTPAVPPKPSTPPAPPPPPPSAGTPTESLGKITIAQRSRIRRTANGRLVLTALSGLTAFDAFGRPFEVDVASFADDDRSVSKMLRRLDGLRSVSQELVGVREKGWSLVSWSAGSDQAPASSFRFASDAFDFRLGLGAPDVYFGLGQGRVAAGEGRSLDSMMFAGLGDAGQMFDMAAGAHMRVQVARRWDVSSFAVTSFNHAALASDLDEAMAYAVDPNEASLMGVGISYRLGSDWSTGLTYGALHERGTVLGDVSEGALALGDSSLTQTVGLSMTRRFGDSFALDGFYSYAMIDALGSVPSILEAQGRTGSQFGVTATADHVMAKGDTFRLSLIKPLQITGGVLNARVPVGREFDGTVNYADRTVMFDGSAMPGNLKLEYLSPWGPLRTAFSFDLSDSDVFGRGELEYGLGAGLSYAF